MYTSISVETAGGATGRRPRDAAGTWDAVEQALEETQGGEFWMYKCIQVATVGISSRSFSAYDRDGAIPEDRDPPWLFQEIVYENVRVERHLASGVVDRLWTTRFDRTAAVILLSSHVEVLPSPWFLRTGRFDDHSELALPPVTVPDLLHGFRTQRRASSTFRRRVSTTITPSFRQCSLFFEIPDAERLYTTELLPAPALRSLYCIGSWWSVRILPKRLSDKHMSLQLVQIALAPPSCASRTPHLSLTLPETPFPPPSPRRVRSPSLRTRPSCASCGKTCAAVLHRGVAGGDGFRVRLPGWRRTRRPRRFPSASNLTLRQRVRGLADAFWHELRLCWGEGRAGGMNAIRGLGLCSTENDFFPCGCRLELCLDASESNT
ncbi:hypothetical protein B0H11DRAFT_1918481 [Mycena galericulata]|nr:hypothetical protein B0H11DRAFT_1918481 [Mycena galericulata]